MKNASPASAFRSSPLPLRLEDLPNVGPAMAADFRRLGIGTPDEIRGRDPYMLYHDLCRATHSLHDPCVLDTFIAVVRHVDGGPAKPWWHYTAERKRLYRGAATAKRDGPPLPSAEGAALHASGNGGRASPTSGSVGAAAHAAVASRARPADRARSPIPRSC
ncbi:MAG: helix-hairpin-helix domain-containing protein [Betaproteobacteria bacterium]